MKHSIPLYCIILSLLFISSCNVNRFIPNGSYLLNEVNLESANNNVQPYSYRAYIRQDPNNRWFSLFKVPLDIYCLSSPDTLKHKKDLFRRIGEAPVIFDETMMEYSRQSIASALHANGYLRARVKTKVDTLKKKVNVTYMMQPGRQYYLDSINYSFDNDTIRRVVTPLLEKSLLHKGFPYDLNSLIEERDRLISQLHNLGYYRIHKEFISFQVDTIPGMRGADLIMNFRRPPGIDSSFVYEPFHIRNVSVYENTLPGEENTLSLSLSRPNKKKLTSPFKPDREKGKFTLFYRNKLNLNKSIFLNNILLRPDSLYSETAFRQTYSLLNGLPAIRFSSIRFAEANAKGKPFLDTDILISRSKTNVIGASLEGTNTNGDLGAAVSLTYANKNLFKGSQSLSFKLRGAYEAITGLKGYNGEKYLEWGGESSLNFPAFHLPMPAGLHRPLKVSGSLSFMYNSQERPEFYRRIVTANWAYEWTFENHPGFKNRYELLSLNGIFVPRISETFRKDYLEGQDSRFSILRSSYEKLFIMRTAYGFVYNSEKDKAAPLGLIAPEAPGELNRGWQLKFNIETAGNFLQLVSKLTHATKNSLGQYKAFKIPFSQYFKTDIDFTRVVALDEHNSFAFHAFFGIAIPYGNSATIPYEKRYFAGGANSIRGWHIRSLGPGSYKGKDGRIDFINQTGNMKIEANCEWRTHLFWKFGGAFFVDAGNIWNTRSYPNLDDGVFRFKSFYKQIALAYGFGLRFKMSYFTLRFDAGVKAINPAYNNVKEHFPIIHPDYKRDVAFNVGVGLPF